MQRLLQGVVKLLLDPAQGSEIASLLRTHDQTTNDDATRASGWARAAQGKTTGKRDFTISTLISSAK